VRDAGIFDGMSKGVRMATGEFVHILNADDRYADSTVLSTMVTAMTSHGWDLCHGRAANVSPSGRLIRVTGRDVDKRQLLKKMRVAHPTVLVRRSVYERFGTFSVGFRVAGDYEFLLRVWDRVPVGFIDRVLVHFAIGGNSSRPENLKRAYRESLAAAVLHGAHPARATVRCSYEILKHRVFFAREYRQP
jgi:glycosyltransferase